VFVTNVIKVTYNTYSARAEVPEDEPYSGSGV
jgi:hypothetical protein